MQSELHHFEFAVIVIVVIIVIIVVIVLYNYMPACKLVNSEG